jgi:hypothetical protein
VRTDRARAPAGRRMRATGRLAEVILLGGSLRATPFSRGIGRSVLDLPIDGARTILAQWRDEAAGLGRAPGEPALRLRVAIDQAGYAPAIPQGESSAVVKIERDGSVYRGTGGVLRDMTEPLRDDETVLVATGAGVLLAPLARVVERMLEAGGDVTLAAGPDGSPGGIMLASRRALASIRGVGFVDLKEQALPAMRESFDVRVARLEVHATATVRSLEQYVEALRALSRAGPDEGAGPFAEDWRPAFSIVEPGARVDPTSRVHDAVVLGGGVVEARAVVARSVVCPGGVVRAGRRETGALVTDARAEPGARRVA